MSPAAQRTSHILALVALFLPGPSLALAQATADFETEEASAALRLSNPWSPTADAIDEASDRPSGRLSNQGDEPVFFLVFAQPALGFEPAEFHVTTDDSGIWIQGEAIRVDPGAPPRAVWLRGALAPGEAVDLGTLDPVARNAVNALFREGRVQIAFLVVARRGPVSVALRGFSPLGPGMPDPVDRGLLYPTPIQLEGTHDLPAKLFVAPQASGVPESEARSQVQPCAAAGTPAEPARSCR